MSVRAKFKCVSKDNAGDSCNIKLEPVITGSEENKSFYKWTPSGHIFLGCVNPAANSVFEFNKEYYVDFTSAEDD